MTNTFVPTDTTARVLADATVYLYFQTTERTSRLLMIEKLIQKANELPGSCKYRYASAAIDAAE